MIKKEKIAAFSTGICLFIFAAIFSISILISALNFGAEDTFLFAFGELLTTVYGFCSILIPAFLFTAGAFCFSETWSVKKACILLISLIPFFTMVFSEHIIRNIIESDSSPAAAMKIFTVVTIGVLLVIAEFLLAVVLAGHFHDKLASLKFGIKSTKKAETSPQENDTIVFEDETGTDSDTETETQVSEDETIDSSRENSEESKEWNLADILEKNRREIQNIANDLNSIPVEKSKYDSIWGLDDNGDIKDESASEASNDAVGTVEEFIDEDAENSALETTEDSAEKSVKDATPAAIEEPAIESADDISFEDYADAPQEPESESQEEVPQEKSQTDIITEMDDFGDLPVYKDDDEETESTSEPELSSEYENASDENHAYADENPGDVIDQFERENMSSDFDEFNLIEDEKAEPEEFSSEIPFDEFDENNSENEESSQEQDIDPLAGDMDSADDEDEKKNYSTSISKANNRSLAQKSTSKPDDSINNDTKPAVSSVFSQLDDVFTRMDADAQSNLPKTKTNVYSDEEEGSDGSSAENSSKRGKNGRGSNTTDQSPEEPASKPAPLVKKRRPPYKISTDVLTEYKESPYWEIDEETKQASANLMATFKEFNIVANVTAIRKGPVVTMFEMLPAPGVKLSKIQALQDNIALRLAAKSVRIVAPIPGKRAVGIEVPNKNRAIVSFRECIEQSRPEWTKMQVPVVLGKDIEGETQLMDLVKTPHLLIAGSTGAGKSVCVNSMILSILYKRSPNEVKMILIDPKIVELSLYNGIGHLLTPVITEPKMAMQALQYCLCEMERRYAVLKSMGCRDILSYNKKIVEQHIATEKLPYIIVVVDEFADLMATTGKQLEAAIARLAAKARAIGIHLVLATQRPSVDVITGLIKANIPSRIAFMVSSKMDSRIIIDQMGAEKLLGKGDMLYASSTDPFPVRIQGALVSDQEVENVVNEVKNLWGEPEYIDDEIFVDDEEDGSDGQMTLFGEGEDPLYEKALDIVIQAGKASASYIQRKLSIGYNRAARLVEIMEERGIVGPANGSKPREIIHIP
ncbi:MAG: cell division protein FtsK [Treponema sp.]|nr:cell division protein FtsK [Treponema sp.]